jgi:hypothetical protein
MLPDREHSSPSSPVHPSQNVRTLLSFLLFLHLFALAVAVTSSNDRSSQLELGLRKTPLLRPYLQTLFMDLPYTYHLTSGISDFQVNDAEMWIEVELNTRPGEPVRIPPADGLEPRQRFNRAESLVRTTASLVGQPDRESVLPAAIAASLLHRHGATGGTIRIMRRNLPLEAFTAIPSTQRTMYEARILLVGGQVELLKTEAASESAPAATGT